MRSIKYIRPFLSVVDYLYSLRVAVELCTSISETVGDMTVRSCYGLACFPEGDNPTLTRFCHAERGGGCVEKSVWGKFKLKY